MATNIVTSDGKDLDSRYLAIGGKAVSAGYADSAGSATNANYAASAGTATNVTNKGSIRRSGNPVSLYISSRSSERASVTGIAFAMEAASNTNYKGVNFGNSFSSPGYSGCFVNQGDLISNPGGETITVQIYPIMIS